MKILVCGAGVAGLATTIYLQRAGHDVTVLEVASELRTAGGPVDVRGDALDYVKELGLWDEMKTQEVHMTDDLMFVDADGAKIAGFPHDMMKDSPEDLEIERIALMPILGSAASANTDFRFSTSIASLADQGDQIHAVLTDDSEDAYDLVVGADGVHSATRKLAFGQPEAAFADFLGVYVGFAPIGPTGPPGTKSMTFNTPGKLIGCVQSRDSEFAVLMFRSPLLEYDYRDPAAVHAVIRDHFQEDAWRTQELIERAIASPGLWMDTATQIKMDTWRKGRVVLVGDAGHCATPLSGRGVSLGISGGRFLAMGLSEFPDDLDAALARYEELQRSPVEHGQGTVHEGIATVLPATEAELEARNAQLKQLTGA